MTLRITREQFRAEPTRWVRAAQGQTIEIEQEGRVVARISYPRAASEDDNPANLKGLAAYDQMRFTQGGLLKLVLTKLPSTLRGIYGATKDKLGAHQLFAHPDLAAAISRLESDGLKLAYSDIFRSAESSRARRQEFEARGGAQLAARPSESPHNWGLAVDIDVSYALKTYRLDKGKLDALLVNYGLYCHRRDHQLSAESWHYNCLGPGAEQWLASASQTSTSRAIEAKVQALYGAQLKLTESEVSAGLKSLGYDGVRDLQADWGLEVDGVAGPKTQRLLAYLTAERVIV